MFFFTSLIIIKPATNRITIKVAISNGVLFDFIDVDCNWGDVTSVLVVLLLDVIIAVEELTLVVDELGKAVCVVFVVTVSVVCVEVDEVKVVEYVDIVVIYCVSEGWLST